MSFTRRIYPILNKEGLLSRGLNRYSPNQPLEPIAARWAAPAQLFVIKMFEFIIPKKCFVCKKFIWWRQTESLFDPLTDEWLGLKKRIHWKCYVNVYNKRIHEDGQKDARL